MTHPVGRGATGLAGEGALRCKDHTLKYPEYSFRPVPQWDKAKDSSVLGGGKRKVKELSQLDVSSWRAGRRARRSRLPLRSRTTSVLGLRFKSLLGPAERAPRHRERDDAAGTCAVVADAPSRRQPSGQPMAVAAADPAARDHRPPSDAGPLHV